MARLKDESWATVADLAASKLSATFKSSTQSDTWLRCEGTFWIKFKFSALTLGTAAKAYICPKFRDASENVTYIYQQDNATPVRWPLTATGNETALFGPFVSYEVGAEVYCDVAAGVTGAATVQAIRCKSE